MAEKKKVAPSERKIVSASSGTEKPVAQKEAATTVAAKPLAGKQGATGRRIGAIVCWLLGIGCEVVAILILNGTFNFSNPATGSNNTMLYLIIALVVDLIFVIIGSQLWKKANDIAPASEKNKVKFFLWNNMGVIASLIAFVPIIVLFLKNKDLDAKTKKIVTAVAAVALVVAAACSFDYNPTSQEQLAAAQENAATQGITTVYWTPYGRCYHTSPDCQSLQHSATIIEGSLEQAFEANRNDPCKFCAQEFLAAAADTADTGTVDVPVDSEPVDSTVDSAA